MQNTTSKKKCVWDLVNSFGKKFYDLVRDLGD